MIHALLAVTVTVTTIAGVPGAVRKVSGGVVTTFHLDSSLPESFDFGGPIGGGIVIEPPGQYPTSPFYGRGHFIASTGAHVLEQRDIHGAPFVHDSVRVGVKNAPGEYDGGVDPTIPVFHGPTAVTVDRRRYPTASCCNPRSIFIADTGNGTIRRLRPYGVLETIAGVPGEGGYADGDGRVARFNGPVGLQIASDGSLIVADTSNHVIRKINIASAPPGPRRRGVRH